MKVELKRDWFGPDNVRRRQGVVEVPDEFEDQLPKDAVLVGDEVPTRRGASFGTKPALPKVPKAKAAKTGTE